MAHPIIPIADALVDRLKARQFSLPVTVTRRSVVRFDLKDLKTCQVSVVPANWTDEPIARRRVKHTYQVDVAVQQKVNVDDLAVTDALMSLVWEINEAMQFMTLVTEPPAQWIKAEAVPGSEPGYAAEHLAEEYRTFTSIRRHTFTAGS